VTVPTLKCSVLPVRSGAANPGLIVLGPSLGTTSSIWDTVAFELAETYRVLRYDLPGHGFSASASEAFTMTDLAVSVLELVDSIGGGSFYYAGDSMGSAVGLTLSAEHPDRVLGIAAFCVTADLGGPDGWHARAQQVRSSGTASVVALSAARWFAPGYLERDPGAGAAALDRLIEIDDESYALCCDALAQFDFTTAAGELGVPAVFVAGGFDIATPPDQVAAFGALVPGAKYAVIPGAGHLPVMERPAEAEVIIRSILPAEGAYEAGMVMRRAVLGDAHVDAANSRITPETEDFQNFITRYAWGEVWSRPGLSRRDRSLITLASLVTGSHENEIGMHVRAALTNGVTRAEISEVILHTAVYAGLPVANAAFAIAREVFAQIDDAAEDAVGRSDSNTEES
jgi:3-oxoadipate enol-lactonase/4-carboxymuconolactone decarboxylase